MYDADSDDCDQQQVSESFKPLAEMDADQQPEDHQASVALSPSTSTSIIPDKPHQPVLSFPFALLVSSGDHFVITALKIPMATLSGSWW